MYFNHAFRRTLLGKNNSGALLNNLVIGSATYSSVSFSATAGATYTMNSAHNFGVGDTVVISGFTGTAVVHNGTWTILSVPSTTTFIVGDYSIIASAGSPAVVAFKSTSTLSAGQLGLFDRNYKPISVTATPGSDPFYIVQGSYYKNSGYSDKIGAHGGYQESVKSKMINPKYISRIFWVQAKAPVQQVVQIPLKAAPNSTNVGLTAETTYRLRIDVKGSPALRYLSHNIYRVLDSYTGPANATTPTLLKDPVATLVDWKEQITMSPYFNQLVQARAYVYKNKITATSVSHDSGLTSTTINTSSTTDAYIGQRVTGTGVPANSFITSISSNSNIVITYPKQSSTPSGMGGTAEYKLYNDVYGANGGYTTPYTNIAVTSGQQPTYEGQPTYIPGSSSYSTSTNTYPGLTQTSGTATGATIAAATTVSSATAGAHIYTAVTDNLTFTTDAFLELTAAYLETKFGNPTFTVTDNYDLEPLKIIASLMDDSGNPVASAPIGTAAQPNALSIGVAGIATEVQAAAQAQGTGETVLRELILTGKYRQEAFGDGTNIDQFRMREIEANPGVLDMMTVANRTSLYNKLCILHNVPRFNNPSGVFDNDQYLVEIAIPNALDISKVMYNTTYVAGGTITSATTGSNSLIGDVILKTSQNAGGAQFVEMI